MPPRTAGVPGEQLGSSSADHQPFRSAHHTALLVLHGDLCNVM